MKTEYIPKVVTLLAGAVVCIICIVRDYEVTYSLELLLLSLVIFYIIGCIAGKVVERVKESNRVMKETMENLTPSKNTMDEPMLDEEGSIQHEEAES